MDATGTTLVLHARCAREIEVKQLNWKDVCQKLHSQGYSSLSEPEEVWVNTRGLIDAVNNGGLVSFFYNSHAERFDETVDALGEIEGLEVLEILEAYGELFGDEVPFDIHDRNAIINSWSHDDPAARVRGQMEDSIMQLMDPLEDKLSRYLIENDLDPDYGI